MTSAPCNPRRGITLLEVLISIGILAVGLTSVVALVPAGRSNAGQALIVDRASRLAENALADAVTFGCLKLQTLGIASGTSSSAIILDIAPTAATLGAISGTYASQGIYTSTHTGAPASVIRQILELRDDIVLREPLDEDSLPRYRNVDGVRAFDGRFTCMLSLAPLSGPMTAGNDARLTTVVFYNRDLTNPLVLGTWDEEGGLLFTPPSDRTRAAIFHAGSVFVQNGRFYRAKSVTYDDSGRAHVLHSGTSFFTSGTAQILVDSVGIAERFVTLEGGGPWSR